MEKLDKLFRIPPVRVKARDGTSDQIVVEHRIGKEAGAFTADDLMSKLGFEDEYLKLVTDLEKKFRDREKFKKLESKVYVGERAKMNRLIGKYRRHLETFYGNYERPLLPMFAFVPVSDKSDGLYLQGLLDAENFKLVVGDPQDDALWCETVFLKTKRHADLNARAKRTAKALISCPGVNKDLAHRMRLLADGEVQGRIGMGG